MSTLESHLLDHAIATTPEQDTDAHAYVVRKLGDQADDVLEMLGLGA